jgi:hypothetical protein
VPANRQRLVPLAASLALAAFSIGCGGSAPSTGHRGAKPHAGTRPAGDDGASGDVAARTRQATLARKGSWELTADKVRAVAPLVQRAARENALREDLVYGIIWVESRFNPQAVSPVGARGLMQLMPKTADYLAERIGWRGRADEFDPEFNIAAGSYYIARLIAQFGGDEELALAAYNAGPTNVNRWMRDGGLPRVSIEYHTMVQTARGFFGGAAGSGARIGAPAASTPSPIPSTDDLDRLGLAILIAGLSDARFGLDRTDDPTPFE